MRAELSDDVGGGSGGVDDGCLGGGIDVSPNGENSRWALTPSSRGCGVEEWSGVLKSTVPPGVTLNVCGESPGAMSCVTTAGEGVASTSGLTMVPAAG